MQFRVLILSWLTVRLCLSWTLFQVFQDSCVPSSQSFPETWSGVHSLNSGLPTSSPQLALCRNWFSRSFLGLLKAFTAAHYYSRPLSGRAMLLFGRSGASLFRAGLETQLRALRTPLQKSRSILFDYAAEMAWNDDTFWRFMRLW